MKTKGKVYKYGDNVDTDVLYPARYNNVSDMDEMVCHSLEDLDPEFIKTVQKGDFIVAGKNFGCGSCREHALVAIRNTGIGGVIAKSFARVFYRSSINIGLPIVECPAAAEAIQNGDEVEVDYAAGKICDLTTGEEFQAAPFPPFIQKIIDAGGLIELVKQDLQ